MLSPPSLSGTDTIPYSTSSQGIQGQPGPPGEPGPKGEPGAGYDILTRAKVSGRVASLAGTDSS